MFCGTNKQWTKNSLNLWSLKLSRDPSLHRLSLGWVKNKKLRKSLKTLQRKYEILPWNFSCLRISLTIHEIWRIPRVNSRISLGIWISPRLQPLSGSREWIYVPFNNTGKIINQTLYKTLIWSQIAHFFRTQIRRNFSEYFIKRKAIRWIQIRDIFTSMWINFSNSVW